MNINDYVYSFKNKIGIILSKKNNLVKVKYENETIDEDPVDLIKISDEVIDLIKSNRIDDLFSLSNIEKGKDYYLENRVKYLVVADKNVTSTVKGNTDYSVNILISKNYLRTKCSCPVGSMCKHVVATLFDLENKINKLTNNTVIEKTQLLNNYKDILDIAVRINPKLNQYKDLIYLEQISNSISNIPNLEELAKFLNELDSYRTNTNLYSLTKDIIYSIIAYSNMNAFIDDLNKYYNNKKIITYIKNKSKFNPNTVVRSYYLDNNDIIDVIIYSIVNHRYEYYYPILTHLHSDLHHIKFLNERFNDAILKELINNDLINLLKKNVVRSIYDIVDDISKVQIVSNYRFQIIDINDLKEMDINIAIEMLSSINDLYDISQYVIEKYKYFGKYNKKTLFKNCYKILNGNIKKSSRSYILSLLENDKDAIYFLALYKNDNIVVNDLELFENTFDIRYFVHENNNQIYEDYYLQFDDFIISEFEIINGDKFYHGMENYLDAILNILSKDEEYNNMLSGLQNSILNKKVLELKQNYLADINNLDVSFKTRRIMSDEAKIKVDYIFESVEDYYDRLGDYSLSFKVSSIGRQYIVKDPYEFLDNIDNSRTYRYGKELEFDHRIDNFRDIDKEILEYLLNIQFNENYGSSKVLYLSERAFERIIEKLKSRIITYNGNEVFVRLNKVRFNTYITSNYELKTGYSKNSTIFGNNKLYIIDNGFIDYVDISIDYKDFVNFAHKNDGMNVALVKDQFINRVYSRYNNLIDIDDSLIDEFNISELRIDAYFDFTKNSIICDTKVYKDDYLLNTDAFLNEVDKNKLLIYKEYIDDLGFVDNILSDSAKILSFLRMDFSNLRKICNVYLSDNILNKTVSSFTSPTIRIRYENNMMEAFMSQSNYSDDELYQIMKAIKLKKNYILLDNDRIVTLDNDDVSGFLDTVMDFKLDIKELSKPKRLEIYDALKAYAHIENCNIDEYLSRVIEDIKNYKNIEYDIPNINAELRKYQREGYGWLRTLAKYHLGGILADDMGLGKTLEVITLLKSDEIMMPSIVICPKSLIYNWYSEVRKFDGDSDIKLIYGTSNERRKIIRNIDNNRKFIYVTAYDSLRNDANYYSNIKFNYIILDEAQAIKNVNAIKSISVKELNGVNKFALTGTPIENNILDLWSIFDFLMPGYFEELPLFKSKYLSNNEYTKVIAKRVAPFILRRTKKEVLKDLPSKYERIISCEMTDDQRLIYDAHIKDAQDKIDSGSGAFDLLPYLTRLRQICIDPKLFLADYESDSGKMIELNNIINKYKNEHKLLIFSSFVKALNRVEVILKNNNIRYYMLTGDTEIEERKVLVEDFNANQGIRVFLISLKAGGTGLNLVGADTVIHLDPWWNVSAENQASDRAHRIGQQKNVEVIKLVSLNSVEERVIELQNLKKDIIDKVISNDDSNITSLSLDDLRYILR